MNLDLRGETTDWPGRIAQLEADVDRLSHTVLLLLDLVRGSETALLMIGTALEEDGVVERVSRAIAGRPNGG